MFVGMTAFAQDTKSGQVYTINDKYIVLQDLSTKPVKGVKVIGEKIVKEGKDTFVYLTLETKGVIVFKNGVLIGGIK